MCFMRVTTTRNKFFAELLLGMSLLSLLSWGQQLTPTWQQDIQRCVKTQDWGAAITIIERQMVLTPGDMDVRAWRARILTWSGKLTKAELEYQTILTAVPNDPDDWMGLATVYVREGRTKEAQEALDRAVALDPTRADLSADRARQMRVLSAQTEASAQ